MNNIRQLEDEVRVLKKELREQLEARKRELCEMQRLQNSFETLEKRYSSLKNSFLGKITLKYWRMRIRLKRLLRKE